MKSAARQSRTEKLRGRRGVNWFASWARSPIDHWNASMPRGIVERELGFAAGMGFDHVRIWLSAHGYEQDPARYIDNLRYLFDAAAARGIDVVVELFDSCGIEPETGSAEEISIEEVRTKVDEQKLGWIVAPERGGGAFLDAAALTPVPFRGEAAVVVWEGWVPNPGYHLIGEEHWPRWDAYAADVVAAIKDHPALLLLEIMNEPFVTIDNASRLPAIRAFYVHMHGLVRELCPDVAISIAGGGMHGFEMHDDDVGGDLDVVSFHAYSPPVTVIQEHIERALERARGRPLYLSEWGEFPSSSDEDQLEGVTRAYEVVRSSGVSWAFAHLVAGYGPFGAAALLYPSGIMRPAGLFLREQMRGSTDA